MLQKQSINTETFELLKQLQRFEEFRDFRLVGGSALALYFGHRMSIDIDLFSYNKEIPENIDLILKDKGFNAIGRDTSKRIKIYSINNIKVDFVNYCYHWIGQCVLEDNVCIASLEDIGAMKLSAITNRGTKKDFIDLYFLLQKYGINELFDFFHQKYPDADDFLTYKSLLYFGDADNDPMPKMLSNVSWQTMKDTIIEVVKKTIK